MATLLKVLINLADIKSARGVALRVGIQDQHMVALYALWYNFVRMHKTLRMSPAMAAGIETSLWTMETVAALVDGRLQRGRASGGDRGSAQGTC
jgi:hypothetical protein